MEKKSKKPKFSITNKKFWLVLTLLVFVGIALAFSQYYDIRIVRKANSLRQVAKKQDENSKSTLSPDLKRKIESLKQENLDVNLENLSEEDLASVRAYLKFKKIKAAAIPTGIPAVYGKELNISFNKVQDAINKVAPFDPTYGKNKIELNSQEKERYIKIGSQTACRYCCSAKTLVFKDGRAACGCAHSKMMRGLAAYLIKNHPEMSDEEILNALNQWRAAFFPKQTITEVLSALKKEGDSGAEEMMKEFPEFLPQMVGGC